MNDSYDDRFWKFNQRLDALESIIHYSIGPCEFCNGSGMLYDQDEDLGRDITRPCDDCRGLGKKQLDMVEMMQSLKKQAKLEVQQSNEIPF